MRILVAEDELVIQEQVQKSLEKQGYVVDLASNGIDALYCGEEYPLDLAIIDLGLPEMDGIEVIKRLRKAGKGLPILILTARSRWQEKVLGLEVGADDYLTKPFHMEELMARVTVLLRRAAGKAENVLKNGRLSLDTGSQKVLFDGESLNLTAYEYRLLHYMLMNVGKVLSKSELVDHIYAEDDDRDSNTIEVFVRRLRKKLDPKGESQPIETLRGRGYRLVEE